MTVTDATELRTVPCPGGAQAMRYPDRSAPLVGATDPRPAPRVLPPIRPGGGPAVLSRSDAGTAKPDRALRARQQRTTRCHDALRRVIGGAPMSTGSFLDRVPD